jgi:hypothetical protein
MPKKVNYAADIQYLHVQVVTLTANLRLPVDGDLFAEQIDREIHFVAVTVGRIIRSLQESSFRQDRLQVLIDLRALAVVVLDLLETVLDDRCPISAALAQQGPRYQRIRESVREMIRDLGYQVGEASRGVEDGEPLVSDEELMHLLAEGE